MKAQYKTLKNSYLKLKNGLALLNIIGIIII